MTAKEMFEDLGFINTEDIKHRGIIKYINKYTVYNEDDEFWDFDYQESITFSDGKYIKAGIHLQKIKTENNENKWFDVDFIISKKLNKAIQQQIKELGWEE